MAGMGGSRENLQVCRHELGTRALVEIWTRAEDSWVDAWVGWEVGVTWSGPRHVGMGQRESVCS